MINEDSITPFKPIQGIVVFEKDREFYLETHDIVEQDGKFAWTEGKPFQKEQLGQLAAALGDQTFEPMQIKGLFPENVLYFQQNFTGINLLWWMPPQVRHLHFKAALKLPSTTYNLPGLIFMVSGKSLSVFAFKGKKRPTLKTKLFKGPFHNTGSNGLVCLGTAGDTKRRKYLQDELARWERRFFGSNFTHGGDNVAKGYNINLTLKAAQKKPFNELALAPSPYRTLEGLVKKLNNLKTDHDD